MTAEQWRQARQVVSWTIETHFRRLKPQYEDDLMQIGLIAAWTALQDQPRHPQAYMGRKVRWALLNFIRDEKPRGYRDDESIPRIVQLAEHSDHSQKEVGWELESQDQMRYYAQFLTDRQNLIVQDTYGDRVRTPIPKSTRSGLHKQAIARLREVCLQP
jgi:DNA-directed RNA polymerase specialized sigma subunit